MDNIRDAVRITIQGRIDYRLWIKSLDTIDLPEPAYGWAVDYLNDHAERKEIKALKSLSSALFDRKEFDAWNKSDKWPEVGVAWYSDGKTIKINPDLITTQETFTRVLDQAWRYYALRYDKTP